jgi:hypothetical protein
VGVLSNYLKFLVDRIWKNVVARAATAKRCIFAITTWMWWDIKVIYLSSQTKFGVWQTLTHFIFRPDMLGGQKIMWLSVCDLWLNSQNGTALPFQKNICEINLYRLLGVFSHTSGKSKIDLLRTYWAYCTILNSSSPTCDCDMSDENFILSP